MELHRQDKLEVLKCWRLHLGCSSATARIMDSVCDQPSLAARSGTNQITKSFLLCNVHQS